jgi:NitT/TauT family transport system substrate-binding protein
VVLGLAACGGSATPPPGSPSQANAAPATPPATAKPSAAAPAESKPQFDVSATSSKPQDGAAAPASKPRADASATGSKPQAGAAAPASKPRPSPAASGLTPLKSAYVVLSTHTLPSWIADSEGFFKQQGLDVQFTYISGSTTAVPALAAGELGVLHATPAASVQAQLKGQDTVILAQHIGTADNRLVARPGINSMADLKGKTVAATRPGTVADLVLREALKRNNLTPDKDVQITFLGDQPAMAAALQNGAVQAALVDVPFYLITVKAGAHVVFNTLDLHYPYPVDGVLSTRKFVREHPDQVVGFLKGYLQGLRFMRANPQKTQEILGKQTKESDKDLLDAAYKDEMDILIDNPVPSLDGIKTVLPLFGGEGKDPADFVDPAPLQKAIQELGPK